MHQHTNTIDLWTDLADLVAHYGACAATSASLRSYQTACTMLGARLEAALFAALKLAGPEAGEDAIEHLVTAGRRIGWIPVAGDEYTQSPVENSHFRVPSGLMAEMIPELLPT